MRRTAPAMIMLLCALFLGACGGNPDSFTFPGEDAVERALPAEAGQAGQAGDATPVSDDIITTGTASVRTDEPAAAAEDFSTTVREAGGRIALSETSSRGDEPRAEVTARVPAEKYRAVVDSLAGHGEVVAQSTQDTDVTQERVDLEARQRALQGSVDRLTELMTGAETVEDLLRAEEMLTQRQGELDSLTAQLDQLRDRVAMSTLTVTFTVDDDGHQPPGLWERMWSAFVTSLETMGIVVVGLLPWLVVLGAVVAVVVALVRRRRRSQGARHADPE